MIKHTTDILTGDIVENETRLSLQQLCDTCSVETEYIITLVIDLIDEIERLRCKLNRL
mgnify:CR=1 FL=1